MKLPLQRTVEICEKAILDYRHIHMWWKLFPEEILTVCVGWFTLKQINGTSHFGHHLTVHIMKYFWEINCQVCSHFKVYTSWVWEYLHYFFHIVGSCHWNHQTLTLPVTFFLPQHKIFTASYFCIGRAHAQSPLDHLWQLPSYYWCVLRSVWIPKEEYLNSCSDFVLST